MKRNIREEAAQLATGIMDGVVTKPNKEQVINMLKCLGFKKAIAETVEDRKLYRDKGITRFIHPKIHAHHTLIKLLKDDIVEGNSLRCVEIALGRLQAVDPECLDRLVESNFVGAVGRSSEFLRY